MVIGEGDAREECLDARSSLTSNRKGSGRTTSAILLYTGTRISYSMILIHHNTGDLSNNKEELMMLLERWRVDGCDGKERRVAIMTCRATTV